MQDDKMTSITLQVVRGDKFSLEGVEVVKERHLERWKNKLRRGLL